MDFYEIGKRELCEHECDPHSLTRTRTLKGGWFGLTGSSTYARSSYMGPTDRSKEASGVDFEYLSNIQSRLLKNIF